MLFHKHQYLLINASSVWDLFVLFIFSFPSLCIQSYEVAILAVLEMVGLGDLRGLSNINDPTIL